MEKVKAERTSKTRSGILLIDDDELLCDVASEFLVEAGYKVFTAGSGEEGLNVVSQNPGEIGLVISDMGLPGIGGAEVLKRIREVSPSMKLAAMSGFGGDAMLQQIKDANIGTFITKPFSRDDLLKLVDSFIGPAP